MGIEDHTSFQVHDLLTDRRFLWNGRWNYLELDPSGIPAHVFAVRKLVRTEHDFDYYL
jgi:starch synthase (maltosyl-transferring)